MSASTAQKKTRVPALDQEVIIFSSVYRGHQQYTPVVLRQSRSSWNDDEVTYGPYLVWAYGRELMNARALLRDSSSEIPSPGLVCWDFKNLRDAEAFCALFATKRISCWLVVSQHTIKKDNLSFILPL